MFLSLGYCDRCMFLSLGYCEDKFSIWCQISIDFTGFGLFPVWSVDTDSTTVWYYVDNSASDLIAVSSI